MSPVPLIDLQRRLTITGAIRAGGEKQSNKPGAKLEAFRVTSPRRQLVEQVAELYGGEVSPWKSPTGDEFQVYTEASVLPVLVMPSYSLRQTYELWQGATKRLRVCDGVEEELSGGACICNAQGKDECDLYTRLVVALPELDTVLGWRLITRGANAAHEMPTMFALIEAQGARSTFVPARLILEQRRGVKDGQVVRYVVPTLDLGVSYLGLASPPLDGAARELPPGNGHEPAARRELGVEAALGAATTSPARSSSRRQVAAFGPEPPLDQMPTTEPPGSPGFGPEPELGDTPPVEVAKPEEQASYSDRRQTAMLTKAQASKLNVLVGQLRDGGHITTEQLYESISERLRNLDVEVMIAVITESAVEHGTDPPRSADGVLHWHPLRDTLRRPEADQLIDWLETKAQRVAASAGVGAPRNPPYNEFPDGY